MNSECAGTNGTCQAGVCEPGILVVRVGTGAAALTSDATATFLDAFAWDGATGTSTALPTAAAGNQQACTLAGTSAAEGHLQRSTDTHRVTLGCYAAAPGTATVSTSTGINRVVAWLNNTDTLDTATGLDSGLDGNMIRSVAAQNGSGYWVGGATGAWYTTQGATSGEVQVMAVPVQARVVSIFNGQLYGDSSTAGYTNVFSIGTGVPTTGPQTATPLAGMTTSGNGLWGYALFHRGAVAGLNTLYYCDDRAVASGGGLFKWTFNGTTWSQAAFTPALATGCRGMTAYVDGSNVVVFAVTTEASANHVLRIVDDGTAAGMVTMIATAPANTQFRGVSLEPL
jgi:hypothetical protein